MKGHCGRAALPNVLPHVAGLRSVVRIVTLMHMMMMMMVMVILVG